MSVGRSTASSVGPMGSGRRASSCARQSRTDYPLAASLSRLVNAKQPLGARHMTELSTFVAPIPQSHDARGRVGHASTVDDRGLHHSVSLVQCSVVTDGATCCGGRRSCYIHVRGTQQFVVRARQKSSIEIVGSVQSAGALCAARRRRRERIARGCGKSKSSRTSIARDPGCGIKTPASQAVARVFDTEGAQKKRPVQFRTGRFPCRCSSML
jgi:hypothetical protein